MAIYSQTYGLYRLENKCLSNIHFPFNYLCISAQKPYVGAYFSETVNFSPYFDNELLEYVGAYSAERNFIEISLKKRNDHKRIFLNGIVGFEDVNGDDDFKLLINNPEVGNSGDIVFRKVMQEEINLWKNGVTKQRAVENLITILHKVSEKNTEPDNKNRYNGVKLIKNFSILAVIVLVIVNLGRIISFDW